MPGKKGTASGIIFMGFGIGAAIGAMFVEELSNYNDVSAVMDKIDGNYYMPKEVGMNYPFV